MTTLMKLAIPGMPAFLKINTKGDVLSKELR